jgi:CubicO group peptidase (beta-lactamase class C family)
MARTRTPRPRSILLVVTVAGSCVLGSAPALVAQTGTSHPAPGPTVAPVRWLVLGPVPLTEEKAPAPDPDAQRRAFDRDLLSSCGGETLVRPTPPPPCSVADHEVAWKAVEPSDGSVDLVKAIGGRDYAVAYALAEVQSPAGGPVLLGLGSDDAIKVWLNGKLVHSHWVQRALTPDEDLVPVELKAGRNQLLLKIQNGTQAWGFAARSLDDKALEEALWLAARGGDLAKMNTILAHGRGLDLDARPRWGLTAWQIARVCGRPKAAELLASKGAHAQVPLPPPESVVDGLLSGLTSGQTPAVVVLVSKDGRVVFEKGYGYESLEKQVRATPETKFRIGSITKQFTAAAILRLQEQGKLGLDDPLSKFFPDYPRGGEVTLRHLLTHTSGIHNYTDKPDFLATVTAPIGSADDFIRSFENDPYDFSPGTRWSYSNSGYFLLGTIVAKVSGQTYADYLRTQFFEPLQMKDTGVYRNGDRLAHDATGYSQETGTLQKAVDWNMSRAGGAGALYSTVEDLARWNEAVFGGRVLSSASLEAAWTPVSLSSPGQPTDEGYGYGWFVSTFRGLREIWHAGGLHGFASQLARFPDEHLSIVVLANVGPPVRGLAPEALSRDIAEIYLGDAMSSRPSTESVTLSADALQAFVGRYDYGQAILTVTREGAQLFAQLGGQPRFEIFPRSADEFFWKVVDAQVTFVRDATGRVVKAHHHQGPASFDAPRLEDEGEIHLAPATLDAYVGRYDYGQGQVVLTVTREGSQLFAQLTGQPRFEIFPRSPTEFFWKVVNARITFVKDETGRVVKGIHEQGGRKMDVPRIE